jgi:prepilin-type N-terminal cleavage/methylation domain-containing protein
VSARRGFSLAELLVAMLLAGIIGLALARLVISQARFVASQDGLLQARSSVRAALNVMSGELRALTLKGLVAATPDSITVRVPYAFGTSCGQLLFFGPTVVSLLPGDSALYRSATASGYAWLDDTGTWRVQDGATVVTNPLYLLICLIPNPPITTLTATGWTFQGVSVSPKIPTPNEGRLVYLYQRIVYAFAPSVALPGRKALWRRVVSTGVSDELVAPFDTGSTFQFLVGSRLTVRATPPGVLDSVVGVRVRLIGQSERIPEGKSAPSRFEVSSNILFRNNSVGN